MRVLGVALFSAVLVGGAEAATLDVNIADLSNDSGDVIVYLYEGAKYDKTKFPSAVDGANALPGTQTKTTRSAQRKATVRFESLAPGTYAVAVHHDENCNGSADKNLVGIPIEGGGFSNNPSISLINWPAFDKSAFNLVEGAMTIEIKAAYPPGYRQHPDACQP